MGDVGLPNADLLGGSATVANGVVDLRVQFADRPFPLSNTHHISWCIDTNMDGGEEGGCGYGDLIGAEKGFTLFGGLDALTTCDFSFNAALAGLDPLKHVWYDAETRTLRVTFPLTLLQDDGVFAYIVVSAFGGSFGANDYAPNVYGFARPGGFQVSESGVLPYRGSLVCSGSDVTPPISVLPPITHPPKTPVLVGSGSGSGSCTVVSKAAAAVAVFSLLAISLALWRRQRRTE